ncbi:CHAT domain-containing protein [Phormidesmis sp. 146-12]
MPRSKIARSIVPPLLLLLTLLATPTAIGQTTKPSEQLTQQATALFQAGETHLRLERYPEAITTLETLLPITQTLQNPLLEAQTLQNLGIAYKITGNYLKAISAHKRAGKLFLQLGDRPALGKLLINLGTDYQELGDYNSAAQSYEQAIAILQQANDPEGQAIAYSNLGTVQAIAQAYAQAQTSYQTSLDLIRSIPEATRDRNREASALMNLGNIFTTLNQTQKALEYEQQALTIVKNTNNRTLQSQALNAIGGIHIDLKQYPQAIPYLQQSLTLSKDIGNKSLQARSSNNLGHALYNTQRYPEAIAQLKSAIQILEDLRQNIVSDQQQVTLFDTQTSTYNLLQQVYAANNQFDQALESSEQGRARAFARLLSIRNQANSVNAQHAKTIVDTIDIPTIQQLAKQENVTLVEYSLIPTDEFRFRGNQNSPSEAVLIYVVQPTGKVTLRKVDLKKQSIEQLIADSRVSLGVNNRGFTPKQPSQPAPNTSPKLKQLHTLLIEPIQDLLPKNPDAPVVFVPQADLFQVPFPALQNSAGEYLIKKHTILTAPSLQVLQEISRSQHSEGETLIVGNPTMPRVISPIEKQPIELIPLAGAGEEAIAIGKLFNAKAFTGNNARKSDILAKLPKARIIHLATHGLLDDFKGLGVPGAIALAPSGTGEPNDGLLTASEILDLKLNAELVVLSACDSGGGKITGDSVIGLSRSFLSAGASSVIVSLWSIPDAPTAELMTEFYRNFKERKLSKAQSLRSAMLKTMRTHPDPKNWAAFTLIGGAN